MAKKAKTAKQAAVERMEADFISKGFRRLDSNLLSAKPPKIKWGDQYKNMRDKKKIEYLEKMACTMNHAAYLVQEERNGLLELIEKQENKIKEMREAMEVNVDMVHKEVDKINEERQKFNSASKKLKGDQIREYLKQCQSSQV